MPYFTPDVDDLDIDVDDFFYEMSDDDKVEMYELLSAEGYISSFKTSDEPTSVLEWEFNSIMSKISSNRLLLTSEEDEMLKRIASRF